MQPLNIIFAGTPDFAAQHLQALLNSQHHVIAVYTQPDKPAGRGKKLQQSAVKQLAVQHQIPIYQPQSLQHIETQQQLIALNADVMVVVAYGLLLPPVILNAPHFGCLNVHGSLLPRWRGAAPIQRAVWAGDHESGVTIMQMDIGLDTGAMLHKVRCKLTHNETSASLYQKLAELAPPALIDVLNGLKQHQFVAEPQNEADSCYAAKLSKAEAKLNWNLPAAQLERCIRAFNPWPISYLITKDDKQQPQTIKVYHANILPHVAQPPGTIIAANKNGIQITTAEGVLNLTQLQPAGKKPMSAQELLNSRRDWFIIHNTLC